MQTKQPKFKFYATLLDAFTGYLRSDAIYERYWGFSENPPHTPEEFKALVDEAHGAGIAVVMDIVHSHSVDNELEGLGDFDGKEGDMYFYSGPRGRHPAWGSRCFDYGRHETQHFLLSNCKYWMEEYHIDGFRFDGVTSMRM